VSQQAAWRIADLNPDIATGPKPAPHPSQRRPHDAATLILIDRSGRVPRVLMGRRHHGHVFMPGRYVFPGGRLERGDGTVPAMGALQDHVERRLGTGALRASATAHAIVCAALRETAEETGLLIGRPAAQPARLGAGWEDFSRAGLVPSVEGVCFVGRSITPRGLARRYDTRFLAVDADRIAAKLDGAVHDEAELVELTWSTIPETAALDLHPITRFILTELESRIEAGIDRDLPVPFFRPVRGVMLRDEIV